MHINMVSMVLVHRGPIGGLGGLGGIGGAIGGLPPPGEDVK